MVLFAVAVLFVVVVVVVVVVLAEWFMVVVVVVVVECFIVLFHLHLVICDAHSHASFA